MRRGWGEEEGGWVGGWVEESRRGRGALARVTRRRRGEHRRAAAASHLMALGIGRGQVARGSCADSDADAAELACVGSRAEYSGRGDGLGRHGDGGVGW